MDEAVLDCLVTEYEDLIATVHLPDAGDRHVVAAAIAARAEVIVTFNLADFPRRELTRFGVEALHPDEFLCRQLAASEPAVLAAARRCRTRLRRPRMRIDDYLAVLARQGLEKTALRLRPHATAL